MSITLTPETEAQIQRWIDGERYPDADAVVEQALKALQEQEHARFLRARELILEGLNSGPGRELTPELMDEIEREAEQAFQRGEKPSPHVCP